MCPWENELSLSDAYNIVPLLNNRQENVSSLLVFLAPPNTVIGRSREAQIRIIP
jgi:hypothetical protein